MRGARLTALPAALVLLLANAAVGGESSSQPRSVSPVPKQGERARVEWTRVESTPLSRPRRHGSAIGERLKVGLISMVTAGVVLRRMAPDGKEKEVGRLEPGTTVYVGDRFDVGKAAAVEMTFGLNARLRVGENSVMRVVNQVQEVRGAVTNIQNDVELEKGSARVRVKRNLHRPSPVIVIAGSMVLTLERSDMVIEHARDKSEVMVLGGTADLILKSRKDTSWSGGNLIRLRREEKILIPSNLAGKLPSKQRMAEAEVAAARKRLSFTLEQARRKLPPVPVRDREMDKP